jgi:hypothetical protein
VGSPASVEMIPLLIRVPPPVITDLVDHATSFMTLGQVGGRLKSQWFLLDCRICRHDYFILDHSNLSTTSLFDHSRPSCTLPPWLWRPTDDSSEPPPPHSCPPQVNFLLKSAPVCKRPHPWHTALKKPMRVTLAGRICRGGGWPRHPFKNKMKHTLCETRSKIVSQIDGRYDKERAATCAMDC